MPLLYDLACVSHWLHIAGMQPEPAAFTLASYSGVHVINAASDNCHTVPLEGLYSSSARTKVPLLLVRLLAPRPPLACH